MRSGQPDLDLSLPGPDPFEESGEGLPGRVLPAGPHVVLDAEGRRAPEPPVRTAREVLGPAVRIEDHAADEHSR